MDKIFKCFKLFFPDGGYGYAWVKLNPDENDLVIYKARCVQMGYVTAFIPYGAIPGEIRNDGARVIKPTTKAIADMYEKTRKTRPFDTAIMDFFWKSMKSPIIEHVGEIKSSDLIKLI